MTTREQLLAAEAAARTFTGWDLSFLGVRELDGPLPWNYEQLAHEALGRARRAVDLGTGGGEVLSRIASGSGTDIIATEQWGPNASVAHQRLMPLGIPLVWCEAEGRGCRSPMGRSTSCSTATKHSRPLRSTACLPRAARC